MDIKVNRFLPAGGFYLYSDEHEELILRPKETYDGAVPSGNSIMAYNLVHLSFLTDEEKYTTAAERQLDFLSSYTAQYPTGYAMFLTALLEYDQPPEKITAVMDEQTEKNSLVSALPVDADVVLLPEPTDEYPLRDGKTTYYVCRGHRCLPPVNDLHELKQG